MLSLHLKPLWSKILYQKKSTIRTWSSAVNKNALWARLPFGMHLRWYNYNELYGNRKHDVLFRLLSVLNPNYHHLPKCGSCHYLHLVVGTMQDTTSASKNHHKYHCHHALERPYAPTPLPLTLLYPFPPIPSLSPPWTINILLKSCILEIPNGYKNKIS